MNHKVCDDTSHERLSAHLGSPWNGATLPHDQATLGHVLAHSERRRSVWHLKELPPEMIRETEIGFLIV
jgi:hypothetical protein